MADPQAADRLTRAQQRKLGILPRQLMVYGVRLKREGIDLAKLPKDEQVGALIGEAMGEEPRAWAEPGIDWDAILAFIERLLPIILQFIAFFG